jgi:hypothetical protein
MSTYNVRAKRWKHGWELHIDGVGVTQSRNLDGAEQMVRDYIETLTDHDTADDAVIIHPDGSALDRPGFDAGPGPPPARLRYLDRPELQTGPLRPRPSARAAV